MCGCKSTFGFVINVIDAEILGRLGLIGASFPGGGRFTYLLNSISLARVTEERLYARLCRIWMQIVEIDNDTWGIAGLLGFRTFQIMEVGSCSLPLVILGPPGRI